MRTEPAGSKEIQILAEALRIQASELRSRGITEIADYFDRDASSLCAGPAGEIPLRTFAKAIHHYKGYIDERPACYSRSEWGQIVIHLRKLANSASQASGWSPGILSVIKRTLWPF
jgi:hypothetical protein